MKNKLKSYCQLLFILLLIAGCKKENSNPFDDEKYQEPAPEEI